ncbi:MAG: TIGR03016 family PEP-CTERM system-associated outer membrane protein [Acetobacteraceae bacterium]|nr:TIGR03016 family PEP-CTERM system-associated outer membrane protein [Acetobacteraceae bacterium]
MTPALAQEAPEGSPASQPPALPPLAAPGDLPPGVPSSPTAPEVRLGRFFDVPFDGARPANPGEAGPSRPYEIIPTLTARLFATDNAFPGSSRGRADFVTSIIPSLTVTADSARIVGRATYSPTAVFHANSSGQNRVDHRFLGAGTISIVPGSVFLDLRGTASVVPIGGGLTSDLPETFPRRDTAQNFVASASPYWIHRFGSLATSILGYSFTYATRQGDTARLSPGALPFFRPSEFTAHTGFAALRTGEDFGRLAVEARVRGTLFEGTGTLDNAHRALGIVETRYAVTRNVQVLAEGGYEDIAFNGTPRFRVSEPVWGVGVRLDPGPNTTIIARYRRRDGFNSPQLNARVGLGARTILFARYEDRLQTQLVQTADLLETVSFDELGNPVDSRTGAPVPEIGGSGLLTQQNGLFRTRRGDASLTYFLDRDTFTLTFRHEQRRVVALDPGTAAFSQESNSAGLIWTRALSDQTSASAQFQYGRFSTPGIARDSDGYTFRATLRHRFNETLVGSIQYQLTNRSTSLAPFATQLNPSGSLQNALIATLTKRF